tara:strand:+ start:426 stop:644 length:219 start_codon:yes stop_codon:yes gene_type:complete
MEKNPYTVQGIILNLYRLSTTLFHLIGLRGNPYILFKKPGKIERILEPHLKGNLLDTKVRIIQILAGSLGFL